MEGRGLHSGQPVRLEILPARAGGGIRFERTDLGQAPPIPASIDYVIESDTLRRTTLGRGEARVHTVEHLLAALVALGVDNARIRLNGPEPPAADGSAMPYLDMIKAAGIKTQRASRQTLAVTDPIVYRDGESDAEIVALPSRQFALTYFAVYPEWCFLGPQSCHITVTPEEFCREVAPARTWCFLDEIETLLRQGLIRGGSLRQAVVIGRQRYINAASDLRFADEPVRHKVIDLLGDLALLGAPLQAHVMAYKSGHAAHARFVRLLRQRLATDISHTDEHE